MSIPSFLLFHDERVEYFALLKNPRMKLGMAQDRDN